MSDRESMEAHWWQNEAEHLERSLREAREALGTISTHRDKNGTLCRSAYVAKNALARLAATPSIPPPTRWDLDANDPHYADLNTSIPPPTEGTEVTHIADDYAEGGYRVEVRAVPPTDLHGLIEEVQAQPGHDEALARGYGVDKPSIPPPTCPMCGKLAGEPGDRILGEPNPDNWDAPNDPTDMGPCPWPEHSAPAIPPPTEANPLTYREKPGTRLTVPFDDEAVPPTPERCPTCGSVFRDWHSAPSDTPMPSTVRFCTDPWHTTPVGEPEDR